MFNLILTDTFSNMAGLASNCDRFGLPVLTFVVFVILNLNVLGVSGAVNEINPRKELTDLATSFNKPEQIHITFGSKPNDIVVMWSSALGEKSSVEFSSNPNAIKTVYAQSAELKEFSANAKKFIHRAELVNLSPGTRYSYRIASGAAGVKSDTFSFNVPLNDPKANHTYMVLADMGLITKALMFVVHEAINTKYDAVFHIGDLAYNLDSQAGSVGDKFMNKIQKFTSIRPYLTTPGDHERFHNYYHYRHRFSTPGASWPMKEGDLWYSLDLGLAHFISINTDAILAGGENRDRQLEWLKADLVKANKNRARVPWIIVTGHKPLYCTKSVMEQECDKEFSGLRLSLEDLFFEYGVDVSFSGHKHSYERSWPMYKGTVFQKNNINPTAPIYIVIGALGYEYLLDSTMSKPFWLAASMSERGKELYGKLKILNATHLVWSVHVASNNVGVDSILVIKRKHESFGAPGQVALEKLKQRQYNPVQLPPEPFKIIDEPTTTNKTFAYLGVSRRTVLIAGVFALSFFIFLFIRHSKIRKIFRV